LPARGSLLFSNSCNYSSADATGIATDAVLPLNFSAFANGSNYCLFYQSVETNVALALSFHFAACDGHGVCSNSTSGTVTLNILAEITPTPLNAFLNENGNYNFPVSSLWINYGGYPNASTLTIFVSGPVNGSLLVNGTQNITSYPTTVAGDLNVTYVPVLYGYGLPFDLFTYYANTSDGVYQSVQATSILNVRFVHQPVILQYVGPPQPVIVWTSGDPAATFSIQLTQHDPLSVDTEAYTLDASGSLGGTVVSLPVEYRDTLTYRLGNGYEDYYIQATGSRENVAGALSNLLFNPCSSSAGIPGTYQGNSAGTGLSFSFTVDDNFPGAATSDTVTIEYWCVEAPGAAGNPNGGAGGGAGGGATVADIFSATGKTRWLLAYDLCFYIAAGFAGLALLFYFIRSLTDIIRCCCPGKSYTRVSES